MKHIFMISLTKSKKLPCIFLLIVGIMLIIGGVTFNPSFVSKHFSSDGILDGSTRDLIYIFEALIITLGFTVCLYSLIKVNESAFAKKIEEKVDKYLHPIVIWDRFWFTPTSLRRLAIFRILIFGFLIWNSLYIWVPGYIESLKNVSPEFFEPLLIIRVLHLSPPTSPFALDIVHLLLTLFAAGAMVGFMTRFCILGSLVLFLYVVGMWWSFEGIHRSESPVFIFAMVALLLSPCGRVLSVDEVIARIRGSKGRGESQRDRDEGLESEYALWPIRLTQVFVAFAYFNAGFWKIKMSGFSWANGAALQFHLIDHHLRGHSITDLGLHIAHHPMLCSALSVLTLVWELGFPIILVFPRLAWIFLPLGLSFHIGTGITMATWFYPLWFCYIAFIDFEAVGPWVKEKIRFFRNFSGFKILFD
ncbi:MAG TPA: hypothetical protein VLB01_02050 [Thermodesulfobacteriota bacterium]|nr:hypothetical protein [Thermodesulfobacteriota bacterium]